MENDKKKNKETIKSEKFCGFFSQRIFYDETNYLLFSHVFYTN